MKKTVILVSIIVINLFSIVSCSAKEKVNLEQSEVGKEVEPESTIESEQINEEDESEDNKVKVKENSIVLPLPTEKLIAENEEYWNQKLPLDYKKFIMEYNGATPIENTFMCEQHEYMVVRFLCILENIKTDNGWYDISVVQSSISERLASDEDFVGVQILPIAELYAGNLLCIDFREDRENPEICVWDHEESGEFEPVTYKVADSFTEFVSRLKQ